MKHLLSLVLVLFFVPMSFAQSKHEKMRAFKTAYITEKLELTSDEAEKFWPVYNESEKQIRELRKQNKKIIIATKSNGDVTQTSPEQAPAETLSKLLKNDREMQKIRESTYKDLKNILSPEKLLKLYVAEAEFNKHLLNEYRKRGPKNQ